MNTAKNKMEITAQNAKFIVENGTKRIDPKTGELIGYDLPAFFRFREVFICKDAVSGFMLMDTKGTLSDHVIYKYYTPTEEARDILKLDTL